jgi:hypothetical protein
VSGLSEANHNTPAAENVLSKFEMSYLGRVWAYPNNPAHRYVMMAQTKCSRPM